MATEHTDSRTIGQQRQKQHWTYRGQVQQIFEEQVSYKDEYFTVEEDEQQQAVPAKGLKSPDQPTPQERAEHNLAHLPFRSWCKQCIQNKSKSDAHPRQKRNSKAPVVQFDFCYFKSLGEQKTTPILTGIDVETGMAMAMAIVVSNKTQDCNYHVQCIQSFLMECGRVQAVLSNTVVQSDQEEHLISLLKATAAKLGNNIAVRQSPAYSSQSQGSVERFHRTLMGQVRTLKAQLETNYDIIITSQHPIIPWLVRHAVYPINRYATHADGNTSFYRRWNNEHRTPLCEFGETVLYHLPHVKDLPKLENRFLPAIWLGKDTATGETLLGIATKVVRSRTIKRQPMPGKYNKQLMDIINNSGLNKFPTAGTTVPLPVAYKPPPRTSKESAAAATQTTGEQTTVKQQQQQPRLPVTDSPMATAPTHQHQRPALPSPKRTVPDEVAEGSSSKQTRRQEAPTGLTRPEAAEPATSRQRITAITVKTNKGQEITACSSEDTNEHTTEMILLEPIINDTEGLDKQLTTQGMKKEVQQMKQQNVYTEVHIDTLTPEQRKNIIQSRWVLRNNGTEVRARIVAKGFTEPVAGIDNIYASTPIYSVLRLLLTLSLNDNWTVRTGDISVAFLHAAAATDDLYMHPPTEFYNKADGIVWKLNKAIYGLRSSPKAWQTHLADVLQQLGLQRSTAEPNIYYTQQRSAYILVYVDDLLLLGDEATVNKIFEAIQQHLLLRPTGTLTVGNTVSCSRTQHHQQRRLLRTWTGRQLQQHTSRRSKDGELQASNSTRNISTEDTISRPWPTTEWRRTQSIPTSSRQTTVDDIHKTRHLLRNKRTCTSIAAANIIGPAEARASTTIHQRNNTLQTDYTTNSQADTDNTRTQRLRWQRLGRMCRNKKVNNRLQHHILRSNNFLRKPNTSNNRTVKRRSRTICHQHGSSGSTTLSKSTHRLTEHQQSKHQDTHRLIER